jgi:hypothetical protein
LVSTEPQNKTRHFLNFGPGTEFATDNPDAGISKDLGSGFPEPAYKAIYGKTGFSEDIEGLTEERLIELLSTGKPTTVILWAKEHMGSATEEYDNQ